MAFIYLDRDIANHPLWTDKPFARGQAWVDLILLARFAPAQAYIRGIRIELERGELAMSQELLADRWGWSRGKVARFLDDMQSNAEIYRRQYNRIDIISICNYNQYQSKQSTDDTTNEQRTGSEQAARSAHNKEGKERKKDKELIYMPHDVLPEDWKLWALENTILSGQRLDDTWQQFHEYWTLGKGKSTKREKWHLSWRKWCERYLNKEPRQKPQNNQDDIYRGVKI